MKTIGCSNEITKAPIKGNLKKFPVFNILFFKY